MCDLSFVTQNISVLLTIQTKKKKNMLFSDTLFDTSTTKFQPNLTYVDSVLKFMTWLQQVCFSAGLQSSSINSDTRYSQ